MRNRAKIFSYSFGLSLVLWLAASSAGSTSLSTPSLSIAARLPSVKSGQDIRVDVNVVNRSSAPAPLAVVNGKGNAEFGCDVALAREDGAPVTLTEYGRSLTGDGSLAVGFGKRLINLQPGQTYSDYLLLNRIYNVNQPGVYTMRIQRKSPADPSAATASNTIKIVVR